MAHVVDTSASDALAKEAARSVAPLTFILAMHADRVSTPLVLQGAGVAIPSAETLRRITFGHPGIGDAEMLCLVAAKLLEWGGQLGHLAKLAEEATEAER